MLKELTRSLLFSLCLGATSTSLLGQDPASQETPPAKEELTPEAKAAVEKLRAELSDDSEARAMLEDILNGSELGPDEGWFPIAQAQSRYYWDAIERKYDSNEDHSISIEEIKVSEKDFARLDRDGDELLTNKDWDWSEHSLSPSPGAMLFSRTDRDANGKISPEEWQQLFDRLDTDSKKFLAIDDLRERFRMPGGGGGSNTPSPDDPSISTLVLGLANQEVGSLQPGPSVEDVAPDFTLKSLDGQEVTLSKEVGDKPIVLIFGNFTCGPFRSQAGNIEKLFERYKDRAKFYLVYVREAHPKGSWWMESNQRVGIEIEQPKDFDGRQKVAATCQKHLDLEIPFLVDNTDDKVGGTYSGMPNRLYLIDSEGKIAFKNGRGPFGFKPRELEQALILLLNEKK